MNKWKYSKLVVMDKNFKGTRQLSKDKNIVEKNNKFCTVDTVLQEAVFTLENNSKEDVNYKS
jgi:hypothetical protein